MAQYLYKNETYTTSVSQDISSFKISINDKFEKIIKMIDLQGYLVYNGTVILKDRLEQTIAKNFVKNCDKFIFSTSGNMPSMDTMKWTRFKTLTNLRGRNAVYFRPGRFEGVLFKPKSKMYFLGFGHMGCRRGDEKDQKVTVKWIINEVHSEEYQTILPDAEKDPEKQWFEIDIQQFGEKPIPVSDGDKIHCLIKTSEDARYTVYYGYDGYQ